MGELFGLMVVERRRRRSSTDVTAENRSDKKSPARLRSSVWAFSDWFQNLLPTQVNPIFSKFIHLRSYWQVSGARSAWAVDFSLPPLRAYSVWRVVIGNGQSAYLPLLPAAHSCSPHSALQPNITEWCRCGVNEGVTIELGECEMLPNDLYGWGWAASRGWCAIL